MQTTDVLNIRLHLNTGEIVSFLADDTDAIENIVTQVGTGKVFALENLIIAGGAQASAFPGASVSRIDLFSDTVLSRWNYQNADADQSLGGEITQSEWETQTQLLRQEAADYDAATATVPAQATAFCHVTLCNNQHLYLRFVLDVPNPTEQRRLMQSLYAIPALVFANREGGVSFVNMKQVVRCVFVPLGEVPATAWKAQERRG